MGDYAPWRRPLTELGLDSTERHHLGGGQLLQDPPHKRKLSNNGQEAQEFKRRQWRPDTTSAPLVDTPPTPAPLPDGPDFWTAAPAGGTPGAALRPQIARQLGHGRPSPGVASSSSSSSSGSSSSRQRQAGWRTTLQRSFPPSGGGLEVQEISSELWQEQEQEQERCVSLESCGGQSGGVLVQEVETDTESVSGTPRSPGSPDQPRGGHGVSIVEVHFAEEEQEEHWQQETDETEEPLVLLEPTLGAAAVNQGGDERALFSLRPIRRLMHTVRRCLSPMAEESCEEMDWSDTRPVAARQRGEVEEEEETSSSTETLYVREDREEETCSESLPVESRVREGMKKEESWSESLPVESRVREGTEREHTCSESLPVESRVRQGTKKEESWSESLPVESRTRGNVSRTDKWSESLPVESRIRCDESGEEKVLAELLPVESRLPEQAKCDITYSESLPVQSRIRGDDCTSKGMKDGLSDESTTSSDESLKSESRSKGKEDTAEQTRAPGRQTRHRTSGSLPHEACKYDYKTSFISRINGSASSDVPAAEANNGVITRVSWSLPNEARVRETKGSPESVTKEPRKRDPNSSMTTRVSSSLPNETRSKESRRRRINVETSSLPNEARVKDKGEVATGGNESLPNEARRKEAEETVKGLHSSLQNGSRAGVNEHQSKTRSSPSSSEKVDKGKPDKVRLNQDLKDKVENRVQNSTENVNEESEVEIVDRTDDKKYNFSALRMKRKQAQLAAKNRGEGAAKASSTRQAKKSTSSSETKSKRNSPGSEEEDCNSGECRLSRDPAQKGDKSGSAKSSPRATMKSGGGEKSSDPLSIAPRSKTSQEIIEDLESDTSWRTLRSTDSKEHLNKDERLEPPTVVTPLTDLECYVTETLMLTTEVRGQPCPEARWVIKPFLSSQQTTSVCTYMDGQLVETGEHRLLQRQGQHRHRLVIPRLNYIDAGRYTVTFSNSQGETASQCKVVVKPLTELRAPHFFTPLVARTVREGERTEFSCEVRGSPLPSVSWFKDSVPLSPGPAVLMRYKLTTGLCSLTLLRPGTGDAGRYTCRASNHHDYTEIQTTLQVLNKEESPRSDSTEMAPLVTAPRAEETPSGITSRPTAAEETSPSVMSYPAEEAASAVIKSHLNEEKMSSDMTSRRSDMTESHGIPSSLNGEVKSPDTTHRPTQDGVASDIESYSSKGITSLDNTFSQNREISQSDSSSCWTEEVAPPVTKGRLAEEVASSGVKSSPTEGQHVQSSDTTPSPETPPGIKSHLTKKTATAPNISSSFVKSPVVREHPIVVAPPVDSPSAKAPPVEKSSRKASLLNKSSGKAPLVDKSSGKAPPVDKPSGKVPLVNKSSGKTPLVDKSSVKALPVDKPSTKIPLVGKSSRKASPVNKSSGKTQLVDKPSGKAQPADSGKVPLVDNPSPDARLVDKSSGKTSLVNKYPGVAPPVDKSSGKVQPVDKSSGKVQPVDKSSGKVQPVDKSSGKVQPVDKSSGKVQPVDKSSGKVQPVDKSSGKVQPVEKSSGKVQPVDKSSGKVQPVDKSSGKVQPVDKSSGKVQPVEKSSGKVQPVDKSSGKVQPVDKSSGKVQPVDKSSGKVQPVEKSSGKVQPVDKSSGKVQPVDKSSGEAPLGVRSHPVELTLPATRSHPIQVPSPAVMSHPIEVDTPIRTSGAEKQNGRASQPNTSPLNPNRLREPTPEETPEDELEADQARLAVHTAPPGDGTDHQLTAGGGSDPDGTDGPDGIDGPDGTDTSDTSDTTDTSDTPATVPPPACQPRPERAPDAVVTERRLRGAEERVLSQPPTVISWRRDTRPVYGSTQVKVMTSPEEEAALEAAEAAPEEAATSEVTVTNEEAEVTEKTEATVEVATEEPAPPPDETPAPAADPAAAEEPPSVQAPSVEEALVPVQAVEGCPARLEGRLSGLPKPTIAWTRDGVTLHTDGERLRQYHDDDGTFGLEIAESRADDVGTYAATAVNSAGQAATEAAFQLLDTSTVGKEWAPDFTTPLLGAKVDEGAAIELDTHVTGVPIPEITWTKNGVPLEDDQRVTLGYESDKATLSIKPAVTSDAGMYKITIKNKLGEISSAVKVKINKVYTVPQFAEKLSDMQQVPSLDAKFSCRATCLPKPEVQWLFNDQPLKSSKKYKIRRDEETCTCTLSVRDCTEEDSGTYTCRATNGEGAADTSATLQVVEKLERKRKLEAPLFLKTIGDCEVFPGMQAKFTGCVAGNPEPECEWYRNDVRIYPSDRIVVENDGSGLVRLTLRTVDETDAGRYRLRIRNSEGEVACESDLTYDSFENTPTKPLKDQYLTLERQLKSGIPMPLADPPIVSRMSDHQLTLSWKPSPAAGQHIPPTYTVEMAKMPEGGFAVINTGVRGCSVEIKRLEPQCDYKFRVIVENKHGASEPSPHIIAHRIGLVPPPPPENPCLPTGDTFRPDSSPLFPRGFDMDKHTSGKGHPPTNGVSRDAHGGEEDDSWRYDRFDPDAHTARLASQRLVLPFPAEFHPPAVVPQSSEPRPPRPRETLPPSARLRPLTDDVDGYVPPSGGRPRRVAHGEEWETKRGSNIVERLLVRKQMEEAAKSFKRAAGLETRNMARFMKPRASERVSERLSDRRWDDDEDRDPPRSTLGSLRTSDRATRSFMPSRTAAEIIGSDDDDLDAPSPSLYTRPSHHSRAASVLDDDYDAPPTYSRAVGSSRHARAASVLDDDEDDDDLEIRTRRRPVPHHTRTASLLAAANDSDDDDMTPYLRRQPRLLGTRDWSATPARSVRATRSPVSGRDREYQDRRERHQELLNNRNRDVSAVPTVTPDWQGELERHLRGRGHSVKDTKSTPVAKPVKSVDTSSVRDWESRFAADV